jgi:hypothetical protein
MECAGAWRDYRCVKYILSGRGECAELRLGEIRAFSIDERAARTADSHRFRYEHLHNALNCLNDEKFLPGVFRSEKPLGGIPDGVDTLRWVRPSQRMAV